MLTVGGRNMIDVKQKILSKIPRTIQNNKSAFQYLLTEVVHFFDAPGTIDIQEQDSQIILKKDNITNQVPYQDCNFYYLKLNTDYQKQCQLYFGVTTKTTDENKKRHSILNTKMIQCYLDQENKLQVESQEQIYHDDETNKYPGFMFRRIDAVKNHMVYDEDGKFMKKEIYRGEMALSLPFLHQSLQNSIVTDDDFSIKIDCPNYEFINIIDDKVYIRTQYDKLEGEKIFITDKSNIDEQLRVLNENILVPIDLQVWNEALGGVMKKS